MTLKLKPIEKGYLEITIKSLPGSTLIMHQWDEKSKRMMREKHAGRKTKNREARDPEAEALAATYFTDDDQIGVPAMAVKSALVGAAHKDIGIEKTLVRKAVFLYTTDSNGLLPLTDYDGPKVREDVVRVGVGSTDLRYRPEFRSWKCKFQLWYDKSWVSENDVVNLIERAGFGVGLLEWRPEKGGEHGRFEVDTTQQIKVGDV